MAAEALRSLGKAGDGCSGRGLYRNRVGKWVLQEDGGGCDGWGRGCCCGLNVAGTG